MKIWDPEHPGCAPETCSGTSYDPCGTVLRTRGRWHDDSMPATAADAVITAGLIHTSTPTGTSTAVSKRAATRIVTVIADWLRGQRQLSIETAIQAAGLIDYGPGDLVPVPTTGPISARGRRAVDTDGTPWWIHDCGAVMPSAARPGPHACHYCDNAPGPWRELYRVAPAPAEVEQVAPPAVVADAFKQPVAIRVSFAPEFEAAIQAMAYRLADEAGIPRHLLTDGPTTADVLREHSAPVEAWMRRQAGETP